MLLLKCITPFHLVNGWCFLECNWFERLQCLQCLDMGEASVGGWGHKNIVTLPRQEHCRANESKLQNWNTTRSTILLFVSWNKGQQWREELQRRLNQMRKVALSANLMEHQIVHQVLLWAHAARGQILGIWGLKSLVQARLTTLSTLSMNPETLSLMQAQGKTGYLTILLGNIISVFTVSI